MQTRQLETFVTLAKTLNYAAAARLLYVSQPAVTQQIARLEEELGVRLFDRTTKKVELTAAGRAFYEDCADILSRLDNARARVRDCAHRFRSSLRVGCGGNADMVRLERLLRLYRARMPEVHLHLTHDDPVNSLGALARGDADVAFGAYVKASTPKDVAFEELLRGRFVCMAPASSPLCGRETLALDDLAGQDLIFLEDGCCPPEMREVLDRVALRMPHSVVYYSASALTTAVMVSAGMGVAVMSDFAFPSVDGVAARPMPEFGEVPYGLFRNGADESARTLAFFDCAREAYA